MCVVTMCIGSWWLKGFIWVESMDRMQDFLGELLAYMRKTFVKLKNMKTKTGVNLCPCLAVPGSLCVNMPVNIEYV